MIDLPVSEAYAFDHLAILYVKQEHGIIDHDYRDAVIWAMRKDIGDSTYVEALNSSLFYDLLKANREVWELVDRASTDECLASEVDAANQRRYAAKKALQERFWPSNPLTEVKAQRPSDLPCQSEKPTVPMTGGGK